MKKIFLFIGVLFILNDLQAQLKTTKICPAINVEILDGKVNGLVLGSNNAQIKAMLPCFTSEVAESASSKCGKNVFYKDKDIYFYTDRGYVEIGPQFKGKLSLPLMGANRNNLFKMLGHPKIKDVSWDAFSTQYGILILYYSKANKVNKIQFSNKSADTINLCE